MNSLLQSVGLILVSKGADPYGLRQRFLKSCRFFTLSSILHLSNSCLDTGFWPFNKASVRLLKEAGKNYSNTFSCRPVSLAFP